MSIFGFDTGPFGGFDLNDDGEVDLFENTLSYDDEEKEFEDDFDDDFDDDNI